MSCTCVASWFEGESSCRTLMVKWNYSKRVFPLLISWWKISNSIPHFIYKLFRWAIYKIALTRKVGGGCVGIASAEAIHCVCRSGSNFLIHTSHVDRGHWCEHFQTWTALKVSTKRPTQESKPYKMPTLTCKKKWTTVTWSRKWRTCCLIHDIRIMQVTLLKLLPLWPALYKFNFSVVGSRRTMSIKKPLCRICIFSLGELFRFLAASWRRSQSVEFCLRVAEMKLSNHALADSTEARLWKSRDTWLLSSSTCFRYGLLQCRIRLPISSTFYLSFPSCDLHKEPRLFQLRDSTESTTRPKNKQDTIFLT